MTTSTRAANISQAREVDTRIAAAWDIFWAARAPLDQTLKGISNSKYNPYAAARVARYEEKLPALRAAVEAARAAVSAIESAEYKGWSRFFLVKHIHSSQRCSSFRDTTKVGWLPSVSGLTEAEAVAEHGAILCTICFPSAPVEHTNGFSQPDPSVCAATGQYVPKEATWGGLGYYVTCPTCGKGVARVQGSGKIRKHK
jgi:hypothetical protein